MTEHRGGSITGPSGFAARSRIARLAGLLMVSLAGCSGTYRVALPPVPPPEQGERFEIWHAGATERWRSLKVTTDSVSGLPFLRPVECEGCRVSLARSAVDSVRVYEPFAGKSVFIIAPLGFVLLVAVGILTDRS
ncbi:MAG: hypothetical protein ABJC74_17900 [Gemmatimonadota bacterium]